MVKLLASLIFSLATLTGCGEVVVFGHVVRENPDKAETAASSPATGTDSTHDARETSAPAADGLSVALLHAVNVTVAPASQASDASVDAAALLDAIRTELRSRNLLDEQNPRADGTADVLIESAATHPTVNAVIFGYQPMAGTLTGQLRVSNASGEARPTSRIVAESRFNVAADSKDKNPLGPLYRRFAVLTADELAGVASSPNK